MMNIHDRFIRIKTVQERTSLSRATIYRQMQKGIFPKQVSIGDMRRGWRESDINKWMEDPVRWHLQNCDKHADGSF
jgi:prophage regulatory protein